MVLFDVAQLERNVEMEEVILDCNPVFKEREMVCILPTQMMLQDAYSLAERQCPPLIKKFSKELYLSC